jgi:hypothetical protein
MKRKGRRRLPPFRGDGWPDANQIDGPAFNNFRWNAYSPAGMLERGAWFWHQVGFRGTAAGWKAGVGILRILAPVILWIAVIVVALYGIVQLI